MIKCRKDRLVGVVLSMPTFCDDDYNLLLDRQRKHIRWLIDHGLKEGSAVLMVNGGFGEGYFLDDDEWRATADVLVDEARGEVPTMCGVYEVSARRAAKKAQYAAEAGIDFIQMAPPHYMVPSEENVFGHFEYVNDAADIGIMAYNTPWTMPAPGFEFTENLFERFTELENVVGIKWDSYDIRHYARMLRLFADRFNFIDNMTTKLSLGARLGIRGFIDFGYANVAPRLSLKLWELLRAKKYDEYEELWSSVPGLAIYGPEGQRWFDMGEGPSTHFKLQTMGMDAGPVFPAQATPPEDWSEIAQRAIEASGIMEWVDWDQSVFD